SFFEDEFKWTRKKSVVVLGIVFLLSANLPIFLKGSLDEMDFWAGTFGLVILALFETIIFFWIFGADKAWAEITRGARIRIPRVFFYIMKYVTPTFLVVILVVWGYQQLPAILAKSEARVWVTRAFLLGLLLVHVYAVRVAWRRRRSNGN
ncbi:MAG: sodium:calcium symporter, partial [Thermodesulfobacteriota bacterium]